jgi:glycosyltransferase involved in cell wall biosynthesis
MRIGHFLPHFPPSGPLGGTGLAVTGLSKALVELGHKVYIYGYGQGRVELGQGIKIRSFKKPGGPAGLAAVLGIRGELHRYIAANSDKLDVMLIHGAFGSSSGMVERACHKAKIATVAYPHIPYSPALFEDRPILKRIFFHLFERPYLRRVLAIHVHAPTHASYFDKLGVNTQCAVIPCGIQSELLENSPPHPGDRAKGAFRLLYFGRLDVWMKGLDLLLEALARRPSPMDGLELVLMGSGSDRALQDLTGIAKRNGIAEIVRFAGHTEQPWEAVQAADLVVLPSRFDGFAQTVCESLALGTPVVVSSRAAPAEYLDRSHGVIVTEPEVEAISESILAAIPDIDELRMRARASKPFLRETLSWTVIARQWMDQFREMGIRTTPGDVAE